MKTIIIYLVVCISNLCAVEGNGREVVGSFFEELSIIEAKGSLGRLVNGSSPSLRIVAKGDIKKLLENLKRNKIPLKEISMEKNSQLSDVSSFKGYLVQLSVNSYGYLSFEDDKIILDWYNLSTH